jgi:heme/copper-type cytochrome/quinol oxidase subunit 1
MPRISVFMIRSALIQLALGGTLGALMFLHKGTNALPFAFRFYTAHVEMMLFGWTLQLALGVAAWILPRFSQAPKYGRLGLAWAAWAMLNSGVLCVSAQSFGIDFEALTVLGRGLELAAVGLFIVFIWGRVKPMMEGMTT